MGLAGVTSQVSQDLWVEWAGADVTVAWGPMAAWEAMAVWEVVWEVMAVDLGPVDAHLVIAAPLEVSYERNFAA